MIKLTLLLAAIAIIGLLYLAYRLLTNHRSLRNLSKIQALIVTQERKIWDRFLFLIAMHNPRDLANSALQEARSNLYNAPEHLSFVGFKAVINEYLKLELTGTMELSIKSELKGLIGLVETQWAQQERAIVELRTRYLKIFKLGRKKLDLLINFQKTPN